MRPRSLLLLLLLLLVPAAPRLVHAAQPPDLAGIAYEQRPGSQLPGNATFQDDTGGTVQLANLFEGKPLILALGYFHCPNLCSVVRASLLGALSRSELVAGRDYSLVVLSIDPLETSGQAAAAKTGEMQRYPLPGAEQNWHFLTGTADKVKAVSDAVGFYARFDSERKTFVHPAGVVFATPAGLVSSYLLGVGYEPSDVRLAVAHAKSNTIATKASPVLLLCFDYDATTGQYTLAVMKLLRLAAALTVAVLAGAICLARFRERRA